MNCDHFNFFVGGGEVGGGGFTRSVALGLCVELVLFLFVKWNGRPSSYRSKNFLFKKSMAKENQESFTQ